MIILLKVAGWEEEEEGGEGDRTRDVTHQLSQQTTTTVRQRRPQRKAVTQHLHCRAERVVQEMNAANHGQCHIRRTPHEERPEHQKGLQQTGVVSHEAAEGTEQPPPHQGEESTPLLAEQAHAHGSPGMRRAVLSQRAARHKPRFRSGSWSGVNESEDGVWVLLLCARPGWPPL